MAFNVGSIRHGGAVGGRASYTASVRGRWVEVIPDARDGTIASAPVLDSPLYSLAQGTLAGGSNEVNQINPVEVPTNASRVMLRVRYDYSASVTTQARVRLYSIYGAPKSGSFFADDAGNYHQILRLDNASGVANGVAFACNQATDIGDQGFRYSEPLDFGTDEWTIDLLGGSYLLVLLDRAMVDDGVLPPSVHAMFLN